MTKVDLSVEVIEASDHIEFCRGDGAKFILKAGGAESGGDLVLYGPTSFPIMNFSPPFNDDIKTRAIQYVLAYPDKPPK